MEINAQSAAATATATAQQEPPARRTREPGGEVIHRHSLAVRLTHWINVLSLTLLLLSGLQIFNAHPRLYWGRQGFEISRPVLAMQAVDGAGGKQRGQLQLGALTFDTTGLFGLSKEDGGLSERGFPAWMTLPSGQDLATARRWHFFFAWLFVLNGVVYLISGLVSRHFRRDLVPTRRQLRGIGGSILDHVRLRHPTGEDARRYNVLQKLAYIAVVFILLPLMLATGLTMSPGMDAALPGLLEIFGGRQSARTIHFICAWSIVLFVLVHVFEVFAAGVVNEMRSMITGRYVVPSNKGQTRA